MLQKKTKYCIFRIIKFTPRR